jgi:hypothetical protein
LARILAVSNMSSIGVSYETQQALKHMATRLVMADNTRIKNEIANIQRTVNDLNQFAEECRALEYLAQVADSEEVDFIKQECKDANE